MVYRYVMAKNLSSAIITRRKITKLYVNVEELHSEQLKKGIISI